MKSWTSQRTGKRLSVLLLAALMMLPALSVMACTAIDTSSQNTAAETRAQDNLVIVASIFAPFDFARTITGDEAEVSMLVPPGTETHSYEPTPVDIALLNSADVFIYVGGESDAWLEKIIDSLDNHNLTLLRLTDMVETVEEEELEDVRETTEHALVEHAADEHVTDEHVGDEHAHEIDEHVWTSLRNSELIINTLADAFSQLDTEHAEYFLTNAQALNDQLAALDERITEIVAHADRSTLVVGDRFPFRYFAEDYGLSYYAAFSGCSTAVDTNPATITFLIDIVRDQDIPVVFSIELSDKRIANTIAEETGTQTLLLHSAHNISRDDFEAGATYLSLMQSNADNLEVALT